MTDEAEETIFLKDPKPGSLGSGAHRCLFMAVTWVGIEMGRREALARFLFSKCELGSLKLNSYPVFLSHELNAMPLALRWWV